MLRVYTDGSCNTASRKGGWAFRVLADNQEPSPPIGGSQDKTTNQRMEVEAAIQGLSQTPEHSEVTLYSDSQYVIRTMQGKFRRKANTDLWQRLDEVAQQRRVSWEWLEDAESYPLFREVHQLAEDMASGRRQAPQSETLRGEAPRAGVQMVDISAKPVTRREARARAVVTMSPGTLNRIKRGQIAKGDVLTAAQIAGIAAAKRTPDLLPFCHPLLLEHIQVQCQLQEQDNTVEITTAVAGSAKTGYEMEALTAAAVAALTVYDMCKSDDPAMTLEVRLVRKSGGKSGVVELAITEGVKKDETKLPTE